MLGPMHDAPLTIAGLVGAMERQFHDKAVTTWSAQGYAVGR